MSLVTGKRIHRYQWTVLPMSKEVLTRINTIAIHEGQPLVASNFKYQWSFDGDEINEDDVDNEENLPEEEESLPPPGMLDLEADVSEDIIRVDNDLNVDNIEGNVEEETEENVNNNQDPQIDIDDNAE